MYKRNKVFVYFHHSITEDDSTFEGSLEFCNREGGEKGRPSRERERTRKKKKKKEEEEKQTRKRNSKKLLNPFTNSSFTLQITLELLNPNL